MITPDLKPKEMCKIPIKVAKRKIKFKAKDLQT